MVAKKHSPIQPRRGDRQRALGAAPDGALQIDLKWVLPKYRSYGAKMDAQIMLGMGDEKAGTSGRSRQLGGNNYRMICKYFFGENQVHLFVKWIGTHREYDELCRAGKQYTVNDY